MPIGVPRIIYCWGEELPPQWTDIYNFIFRRRMVFLMQYLDDELCNQICGLLINIHMEDRSKELEKKEIEKSGIFKSAPKTTKESNSNLPTQALFDSKNEGKKLKKDRSASMDDLLSSYGNSLSSKTGLASQGIEEDLAIDENYTLEQYTLQKITLEWLNWNAQFFDYSDEPYLFYLAEILSKDFSQWTSQDNNGQLFHNLNDAKSTYGNKLGAKASGIKNNAFEVYSPFRSILNLANLISKDKKFNINNLLPDSLIKNASHKSISNFTNSSKDSNNLSLPQGTFNRELLKQFTQLNQLRKPGLNKLLGVLASKDFLNKNLNSQKQQSVASKVLGQRNLRKEYSLDNTTFNFSTEGAPFIKHPMHSTFGQSEKNKKALNYLDFDSNKAASLAYGRSGRNQKNFAESGSNRRQTKRALQEEESKKVFVIINSFGGSVGNGITVHDALQFIKAGSLTLGLGVAASAASLVLAGGTISERYVTEGCHVMIHQPECLTPDHDVLTTEGWLPIASVTTNHMVAVLAQDGSLSYAHPTKTHTYSYKGNMYKVESGQVDLVVTPEHKMYASVNESDKPGVYTLIEAQNLLGQRICYKKDAVWPAPDYQFFLPEITKKTSQVNTIQKIPSKKISMEAWLPFVGLWITKGHCTSDENQQEYVTVLTQKKISSFLNLDLKNAPFTSIDEEPYPSVTLTKGEESKQATGAFEKSNYKHGSSMTLLKSEPNLFFKLRSETEKIRDLITKLGYSFLEEVMEGKDSGTTQFKIYDKQLWSYFSSLSSEFKKTPPFKKGVLNKCLPTWVWNLSAAQCNLLLKGLFLGDGSENINDQTRHYFTSSEKLGHDISRLALHAGFSTNFELFTSQNFKAVEELKNANSENRDGQVMTVNNPLWRITILSKAQCKPIVNDSKSLPYSSSFYAKDPTEKKRFASLEGLDDCFVPYEGLVYCLTVPNSVFYVKRNGKPIWTGNSGLNGQASDIWIDSQEIMKIRLDVAEIYSLSAHRPRHKILRDLDRDFYLTATETIHYGLADEIATNEVMHEIIEMTSKVWDYHDSKQQRLLETRNSANAVDTQTQS